MLQANIRLIDKLRPNHGKTNHNVNENVVGSTDKCMFLKKVDLDLTSVSRTLELFIMFIIKLKFEITLFWLKFPQIHIC